MTHLSILIVDADEIWRRGFRRLVEEEGGWEVCGEAADGDSAFELLSQLRPDVVAMDGSLPIDIIAYLHRVRPEAGILVFGSHHRHDAVDGILTAGARGLVSKSDSAEMVLDAIETVARNDPFLSPSASEIVLERYLGRPAQRTEARRPQQLTRRECDVVRLLAEGKSNRELARTLAISVKTVENHRANAMRKLGVHTIGDLVREAIRHGMIES
ncbi:MAG: LuxR C-terminal-related transcriptional regulator [Vicinamibacteria bacterium]